MGLTLLGHLASVAAQTGPTARHIDPATGYRIERYRAPVPDSAPGATRIGLDGVVAHARAGSAVLVDVMAHVGAGFDPITGAWFVSEPHDTIPGATWLPDVGTGHPGPQIEAYFAAELTRLTGGDRDRPIVIFCQADCWMSWNAAIRATRLGYRRVLWFAEGIDDWRAAGLPLVRATPIPVPH